jgi:hypothetical protein
MRRLLMVPLMALVVGLGVPAGAGARVVPAVYPYPVSVTVTGPGSVTDAAGLISCPTTCSSEYPSGQTATFTETPQASAQFGGWTTSAPVMSGCTSTSTTCEVHIDCDSCGASVSVAATFNPVLTAAITGSGTITGSGGINCPTVCSFAATAGQQITLTATPASGYQFSTWSGGGCAFQTAACTFTIQSGQTVTANFTKLLTVKVYIAGSYGDTTGDLGTVTDDWGSINCPTICSATYPTGPRSRSPSIPDRSAASRITSTGSRAAPVAAGTLASSTRKPLRTRSPARR